MRSVCTSLLAVATTYPCFKTDATGQFSKDAFFSSQNDSKDMKEQSWLEFKINLNWENLNPTV